MEGLTWELALEVIVAARLFLLESLEEDLRVAMTSGALASKQENHAGRGCLTPAEAVFANLNWTTLNCLRKYPCHKAEVAWIAMIQAGCDICDRFSTTK